VLFDVLLSLMLLATTLLGAAAALVQSLAASHAASMQTTAVDLAADLTESLQADNTNRELQFVRWRENVARKLPSGIAAASPSDSAEAGSDTSRLELSTRWRDRADAQWFALNLPYVPPPPAPAP
jgi:Tfp pilus assembly protein PilV